MPFIFAFLSQVLRIESLSFPAEPLTKLFAIDPFNESLMVFPLLNRLNTFAIETLMVFRIEPIQNPSLLNLLLNA